MLPTILAKMMVAAIYCSVAAERSAPISTAALFNLVSESRIRLRASYPGPLTATRPGGPACGVLVRQLRASARRLSLSYR